MRFYKNILATSLLTLTISANAATFNIVYDDFPDNTVGNIIGTGTLSYDGEIQFGSFSMSSLTNLTFSASIDSYNFTTRDLTTNMGASGINVFDLGNGTSGLVFTGNGGLNGGSFDFINQAMMRLAHEPTFAINNGVGCCGGDGNINTFFISDNITERFGSYQASSVSAVPEPSAYALMLGGLGLVGFMAMRRRKQLQ